MQENRKSLVSNNKKLKKILDNNSYRRNPPLIGFFLLIIVYVLLTFIMIRGLTSDQVVMLGGNPTPIRALAGAFTSVSNSCLILLVVFYGKPGFIVSLLILLGNLPNLFISIFVRHDFTNLSGLFTNIFAIIVIILIFVNNQNIRKYQVRIRDQVLVHRLTGLPNRFACSEVMDKLIRQREEFAIVTLNLNNFKNINNTMGVQTGNEVLIEVASRLNKAMESDRGRKKDFVTCQGGDEFAVIIRGCSSEDDILRAIEYYRQALEDRITLDEVDYYITACFGYALYPEDADNSDMMLSHANAAMFVAKRSNEHHICRYKPEIVNEKYMLEIENKIRNALDNDTLFFHLQPQYDVSHKLIGFEALARMKDADGNFISPGDFIPIAEQFGLIDKIDYTVLKKSAMFMKDLITETNTDITLSANVSVKHLMKNDFLDEIRQVLDMTGIPPRQLEIEVTESIMIDKVEMALHRIQEMKKMGVKIAIDDFGTGYSSLSYLNSFPADMLKVDKSFIDQMNTSDSSRQYVAAIISLGHVMNFRVISEGVEQDDQLQTLQSIGCDYIQGYIWGRPMEPQAAREIVLQSLPS